MLRSTPSAASGVSTESAAVAAKATVVLLAFIRLLGQIAAAGVK